MSFLEDRTTAGEQRCPWCSEPNDMSVYLGKEGKQSPRPGDFGICFSCATPSVYQEHGHPRAPTESEWASLNDDDNITRTRREIFMINSRHRNIEYRTGGVSQVDESDGD